MTAYTLRDIERNLDSRFVERGSQYAREGHVSALKRGERPGSLTARVKGNEIQPYEVSVLVVRGRTGANIYGVCSCPMHINCKHVAAALLAHLNGSAEPARPKAAPAPAARPRAPAPVRKEMSPALQSWLDLTARTAAPEVPTEQYAPGTIHRLLYVLKIHEHLGERRLGLRTMIARILKSGEYGSAASWTNVQGALERPPAFVLADDLRVLRQLLLDAQRSVDGSFFLHGANGADLLARMLATGRCHWDSLRGPALKLAGERTGSIAWEFDHLGTQRLRIATQPASNTFLPLGPPWYVDTERGECGPIVLAVPMHLADLLARTPEIPMDQVEPVQSSLAALRMGAHVPLPVVPETQDVSAKTITPCLRLMSLVTHGIYGARNHPFGEPLEVATLSFDYDGVPVARDTPGLVTSFRDGKLWRMKRDAKTERAAHRVLEQAGFAKVSYALRHYTGAHRNDYTMMDPDDWVAFMAFDFPRLESQGWRLETDENFRFRVARVSDWSARIETSGQDWFDFHLEADIDGKRSDLLPIVLAALRDDADLALTLNDPKTAADQQIILTLDDGRLFPAPVARLRGILAIVHELLDKDSDTARLPRLDAARLAHLEASTDLRWQGGEDLRALGRRLAHFERIAQVAAPPGFGASLRAYQSDGLSWIGFLREFGINGILADDMGLGKTVQALAHVLLEKQSGRLDRPVLVISPTSVLPNWRAEAQRFAPQLRVHVSHGLDRKAAFGQFANADVVLTTYPLLARDKDVLLKQPFHLVILDEAQLIKNAQTQAARIAGQLNARHRLCMTGTPLENHLGELWSLFHFLMPGFLGDEKTFRRTYRTPIEKHGDEFRRQSLARRIRPFILRRTKEQVAAELPPKSEILRSVEFGGAQRDLYEAVRVSLHEKVRAEIQARGFAQSHIIVLDALLKLRQICCDPRLLKIDAAKKVRDSAKLQMLMEMLPELIDEGRSVLLFSQFTSMLALIEERLKALGIRYVKLTGDTRNREQPVKAFQNGEVKLFLISLKAGGTGLNLTAADTVIHYDPWWNPAVENQATDRAHRIGQDKPVFVYKLIVAGSVEEKITAMQKNKAALAASLLDGAQKGGTALSAEDIAALFEPMA
ncbi:MAG: helicase SNF2 [Betaproteobacteria bacterium]|nr:helicase SNF2 [Betaproteobacteria bacterium]